MGELETFRDSAKQAIQQHFTLYKMLSDIEDGPNVLWWNNDNINAFLTAAQKAGASLIYWFESVSDAPGHEGEIESIHIAFACQGYLHLFVQEASWSE